MIFMGTSFSVVDDLGTPFCRLSMLLMKWGHKTTHFHCRRGMGAVRKYIHTFVNTLLAINYIEFLASFEGH